MPELIVRGNCRTDPYAWEDHNFTGYCEAGTHRCIAKHAVSKPGTKCRRHSGVGGSYTCEDSDRISFTCTNYAGRFRG